MSQIVTYRDFDGPHCHPSKPARYQDCLDNPAWRPYTSSIYIKADVDLGVGRGPGFWGAFGMTVARGVSNIAQWGMFAAIGNLFAGRFNAGSFWSNPTLTANTGNFWSNPTLGNARGTSIFGNAGGYAGGDVFAGSTFDKEHTYALPTTGGAKAPAKTTGNDGAGNGTPTATGSGSGTGTGTRAGEGTGTGAGAGTGTRAGAGTGAGSGSPVDEGKTPTAEEFNKFVKDTSGKKAGVIHNTAKTTLDVSNNAGVDNVKEGRANGTNKSDVDSNNGYLTFVTITDKSGNTYTLTDPQVDDKGKLTYKVDFVDLTKDDGQTGAVKENTEYQKGTRLEIQIKNGKMFVINSTNQAIAIPE